MVAARNGRQPARLGPFGVRQEHGDDAEAVPGVGTVLASFTRRAMAARISSFCQTPKPPGPMNTAQAAQSASAASMAG